MGYSIYRPTGTIHYEPDSAFNGFTLFTVLGGDTTYLIDMAGTLVHTWRAPAPWLPYYGYLLENGNLLLRCSTGKEPWLMMGGGSGAVVELDWDGRVVWQYEDPTLHHDHCRLRNGNTLLLLWERLPSEIWRRVQGGVPGTELEDGQAMLGDLLREVTPAGETVWEWHAWQALDPVADPICPLHLRHEWSHCNAVEELADGNLVVSYRLLDTIAIVDRATGQFAWRWGRGEVSHQHDPTQLPNGNLLLFDNGIHYHGLSRSRVLEVSPTTNEIVWRYTGAPEISFFSPHISGAQRLPNGNTLICEGSAGRLFEVTHEGDIVWEYVSRYTATYRNEPGNSFIFRAHRYAADSPQLRGRV